MNKRLASATGGVLLATALLSGCSVAAQPQQQETVLKMGWQTGNLTAINAIIEKFEAEHPGVKIDLATAEDGDYSKTLMTQLVAGTAPDLMMVWPYLGSAGATSTLPKQGYLAPLDDLPWAKEAPAGAREAASYDGKVWMVTPAVDTIGAIYNTDALAKADLKQPTTWSELIQFCTDAKAKGKKAAFGLGLQEAWMAQLIPLTLVTNEISDVEKFNTSLQDGSYNFSTAPEWKAALDKQKQLVDAGCFNDSPLGTSRDTVLPGVISGDFLGMVSVGADIGNLTDPKSGDPKGQFTITALPGSDVADASRMNVLYNNGIAVNAKGKNVALAKEFVALFSSSWGLNQLASAQKLVPSVPNADFKPVPAQADVLAFTEKGRVAGGSWTPGSETQSALINGVQAIILGDQTVQETVDEMQKGYEKNLAGK